MRCGAPNSPAPLVYQIVALMSSPWLTEPSYGLKTDSSSIHRNSGMNVSVSSWPHRSIPQAVASSMVKGLYSCFFCQRFCWNIPLIILIFHPEDLGAGTPGPNNFCSSSTEGPPRTWQPGETNDPINQIPSLRRLYLMIFLIIIL